MSQHEILSSAPLLDKNGNIAEPGFAKKLLPVYRRADIKASPLRIKEWDYYLINNGRFALALTIDDNGYMGLDSKRTGRLQQAPCASCRSESASFPKRAPSAIPLPRAKTTACISKTRVTARAR